MNTETEGGTRPAAVAALVAGGSAGALEAFSRLFAGLPEDFTVPIVIVLHRPRRDYSELPSALAAALGRPVREPQDKEPLAGATIYLAPADYHLLIDRDSAFALSVDAPVNFSRPSIDVLFESAADALGARLAGILLSGANADGAQGLQAIEAAGGRSFIQFPDDAANPAMPNAAIAACRYAWVLPTRELRERLLELAGCGKAIAP